jgi:Protein of unknown function (DUF3307)
MLLLTKLVLAHLLGDFVFQPAKWVERKEIKKYRAWELYVHAIIHGLLIILLLQDFNFWVPTVIAVSHLMIDLGKLVFQKDKTKRSWFMIDQVLHLGVILSVWYYIETPSFDPNVVDSPHVLLFITSIVFITTPASIIIKTFVSQWTTALSKPNPNNPTIKIPSSSQIDTTSLQNAGKIIGILERLFVFTFILTNQWEAIGFLIAAKSVFRFGDLKESKDLKLTEYVLIGTLLSFGIAIAAGLLIKTALQFP